MKVELVFITFLLICIVLVARCSTERRRQQTSGTQTPARNVPLAIPTPEREPQPTLVSPSPQSRLLDENAFRTKQINVGLASYYQKIFQGHLTASGEPYDPNELTAAHNSYPFGTLVRVTNLDNGKHVVVRVNDRGPYKPNRIIDLSSEAAKILGVIDAGIAKVQLEIL